MIDPTPNPVNNPLQASRQMKWASALSTRPSLEAALTEVLERARQKLEAPADLGLIFISAAFASEYPRLMPLLQEQLSGIAVIGCSGGGVVGIDGGDQPQEIEGQAALSLTLAHLPDVRAKVFQIAPESLPDLDSPPQAWVDLIGVPSEQHPHFILLADPFSSGTNDLLQGLDFAYPGAVKVGGLASTGAMAGRVSLFADFQLYQEGVVGVALSGNLVMEAIVAQGCRPIGQPFRVTQGERNILLALEKQTNGDMTNFGAQSCTPLEALRAIIQDLSEADRALAQNSLFIGVARDEFKQELQQGDFLIRNLLGVDPRVGAIAIADRVRTGQRIQFHLRDARTSAEDLELLLQRYQQEEAIKTTSPVAAFMFTCMGRGETLYQQPSFDSTLFERYFAAMPLSGFFCSGEIGPVGGATFLHGYTSVFGICRQPGSE